MGDDAPQNLPSPDPGESREVVSQQDLDALLSEAAELAAEIASDVGVDELDPADVDAMGLAVASANDAALGETAPSRDELPETDVDKKLADLDRMIAQTQDELGVSAPGEAASEDGFEGIHLPPAKTQGEALGTRLPPVEPQADHEALRLGPTVEPARVDPDVPMHRRVPKDEDDRMDLASIRPATEEENQEDDLPDLAAKEPATEEENQEDDLLDLAARASDAAITPKEAPRVSYALTDDVNVIPPAEDATSENPPVASETSVPDFMQEFTEPADDAPKTPAACHAADNPSDFAEPEPSGPEVVAPKTDPRPVRARPPSTPRSPRPEKASARLGALRAVARCAAALVMFASPIALRVADRGMDLLDVANRPVRWLGHGAREALGWLAIATLATSVLVFLVSLF